MKVYNYDMRGNGTIFVAPGNDHPETSDWIKVGRDANGQETREATQFAVKFENGVADIADNLARYLIDKKLARKSPSLLRRIAPLPTATDDYPVQRPPLIQVGRPLAEVLRR